MLGQKIKMTALAVMAAVALATVCVQSALAADQFVVSYRMPQWKAAHFDDLKSANALHATVTKLGCQTKKGAHGGHYDVSYVCPQWRQISLESHDEAHQWEKWLKANGFETKHSH